MVAPSSSSAGLTLAVSPSFVVRDDQGQNMAGVPVAVSVAGGGKLVGAPTRTATSGATSVGEWTLGAQAAANVLTVSVSGVPPLVLTVQGTAGPATNLAARTPTAIQGVVGQAISPAPTVVVTDAFGNAVGGARVSVTGGGVTASTLTADAQGILTIPWTLGTVAGASTLTVAVGSARLDFTAAVAAGPPSQLAVVSGNGQRVYAGRSAQPVVLSVRDQYGNGIPGATVSFDATGGGRVASVSAVTIADGSVTSPVWTMGKSVVPQQLRAVSGSFGAVVDATIESSFDISVRFYGPGMSEAHQALFTAAAQRISAMVVGDLPGVSAFGVDVARLCDVPGLPALNEVIDDVIIFASIAAIDGPGQILAQAGPCAIRSSGTQLPVVGVMEFDGADLASMAGQGSLQDVIMHEMMHVLGIGTYWNSGGLLRDYNTASVAYTGGQGVEGCRAQGGASICASTVPVENTGGDGTKNAHWRESVFGNELMTGYANAGGMPISRMTIGAFLDIGYAINFDAAASYQIPGTTSAAGSGASFSITGARRTAWERIIEPRILISNGGKVEVSP